MDSNARQIPNLAAILQTLSAYAPPQCPVQAVTPDLEVGEYDPSRYVSAQCMPVTSGVRDSTLAVPSTTPPPTVKFRPPATESGPPPSASGIRTWPRALNYTIQHIFSDPNKKHRIQHLIQTQHAHEKQWCASREDVIRKAQGRDKSRKDLDSVLYGTSLLPRMTFAYLPQASTPKKKVHQLNNVWRARNRG